MRAPACSFERGEAGSAIRVSMTDKILLPIVCCLAAALTSACFGFERKSTVTGPTGSGVAALVGSWTSDNIVPNPASCTNFKWTAAEQTANSARGAFSATCANDLRLSGTADGTLNGSVVNWSAQGTASGATGLPSCAFTLTGTAELGVDSIRVPYSGDTCLGRVSGVEVLRKQ
jgi:hypothetical protein